MTAPSPSANRLANETSPYLQQHAHNPVDWFPWSPEALGRSRAEDKPILLSVGYSACHWCHVMERESFEEPATAALMNEHFVCIKVDREERPDIDQIYQTAVQILGRHGGWPLTVFLTPDLKPFYGGTYFPPTDRYGMPAFPRVLREVARAYREDRRQVQLRAEELTGYLTETEAGEYRDDQLPSTSAFVSAAESLVARFDGTHGGFGTQPKFPNSTALEFWLRHGQATGDRAYFDRVELSCRRMIEGGIYDQLGGGFHRYSTDERWLIPHFEKMLYDNALLLRLLIQVFQVTGEPLFARAARETAEYVLREMTSPAGGFFSTQDADSEGEEGKFFAWTPDQLASALGGETARLFGLAFGVTDEGNFEHRHSVLHRAVPIEEAARRLQSDPAVAEKEIERARRKLYEVREARVHPNRDEKILTAWNGLMIHALALTGAVLGETRYTAAASAASDFIARELWRDGRLLRTWRDGQSKIPAFSEDYAFLAEGELALLEATGNPVHFTRAQTLADLALTLFGDEEGGALFVASQGGEPSIHRPKSSFDNAVPSATSSLILVLCKMHALTGEGVYLEKAEQSLRTLHRAMKQSPFGFTYLWCAADALHQGLSTLVVAGAEDDSVRAGLLAAARGLYRPNRIVLPWDPSAQPPSGLASLLAGKEGPAAYLCQAGTCSLPLRSVDAMSAALGASGH